jgi:pilus assembly protein CpaE
VDDVARVVLALEEHDVAEEVMQFLDRSGRARVVATAGDDQQLVEAVRQLEPDAVVAQPALLDGSETLRAVSLLALDTRESVSSLRTAIRAGAAGYFLWPGEREQLISATAATVRRAEPSSRRSPVVAVHGARGGVGATFVATHLAQAAARRGGSCILIDADPLFGDVATALGAPQEDVHTFGDLLPLIGELAPEHLEETLWDHPAALRVLLPPEPEDALRVRGDDVRAVIGVAAALGCPVIVQAPRALGEVGLAAVESADRVLEVLALDVASFRCSRRVIDVIGPDRVGFVVNRAGRSEIAPGDVHRVFGADPLAVLPVSRTVSRAQDHGRLLPPRSRIGRAFDRLAATVFATD